MAVALFDHHHSQLSQALIYLFEKRLGIELYRPCGQEWYPEYYWHPIEEEARANLTKGNTYAGELAAAINSEFSWQRGPAREAYFSQDNMSFRWLPLDRVRELDYIVCTSDRNQQRFFNLRKNFGLKAKIIRYIGNREEDVDGSTFDIGLMATLRYYEEFKNLKPCILYRPEFDTSLYSYSPTPVSEKPIVRSFLNFQWHHREPGSPWETWQRYVGYGNEIGALSFMHGLGTPPPGVEVELDVILDKSFTKANRPDLMDRSKWPDLRFNQGEPKNHEQISELMKVSNLAVHIKRGSEGYGFVIHCLAACGRPMVVEEEAYRHLSAYRFLKHRETCLFVTGHDPTDKENYRWALEPENNRRLSRNLYLSFVDNVNFESEAEAFKKLL